MLAFHGASDRVSGPAYGRGVGAKGRADHVRASLPKPAVPELPP